VMMAEVEMKVVEEVEVEWTLVVETVEEERRDGGHERGRQEPTNVEGAANLVLPEVEASPEKMEVEVVLLKDLVL
ncbi:hypothetical protein, partial [Klebsiella pneumoniae]|uniref:hypothetical protein n=1 Tax=Klebsiella pneumoniae TaxID=573 RepID=UPI00273114A4